MSRPHRPSNKKHLVAYAIIHVSKYSTSSWEGRKHGLKIITFLGVACLKKGGETYATRDVSYL
jgi:hypothetical protein